MQFPDLDLEKMPKSGVVLAYTREEIILKKYRSLEEVLRLLEAKELLEVHLFDAKQEYRAVKSESKRWLHKGGIIEEIITESVHDDIYVVDAVLDKEFKKEMENGSIKVVNYIHYDEYGSAVIDNYRLVEGGI